MAAMRIDSRAAYQQSVISGINEAIRRQFGPAAGQVGMGKLIPELHKMRAYPNLAALRLSPLPGELHLIKTADIPCEQLSAAKKHVAAGEWMTMHAAAGEGTRLAMGTKYLITPRQLIDRRQEVLLATEAFLQGQASEPALSLLRTILGEKDLEKEKEKVQKLHDSLQRPLDKDRAEQYLPLSFGSRHMLGLAYDLTLLAQELRQRPADVLGRKKIIVFLNEQTTNQILEEVGKYNFFGFNPDNVIFVEQWAYPGITVENGKARFVANSPQRLHNHGNMLMQLAMQQSAFRVNVESGSGKIVRSYLELPAMQSFMESASTLTAFNIEDLPFVADGAVQIPVIATLSDLIDKGFQMTMEMVAQKTPPQKGGFWAFDPILNGGRGIVLETGAAGDLFDEGNPASLARIELLNKNFNGYDPKALFDALARGLPPHLTAKGGFLYPQPPQGDLNLGLRGTAYTKVYPVVPIANLKVIEDAQPTLGSFAQQDSRPGFLDFARRWVTSL